jgi:hypothetical protein
MSENPGFLLQAGHSLVFVSRASLTNGSSIKTDVFTIRVRQRVTADRGETRTKRPVRILIVTLDF